MLLLLLRVLLLLLEGEVFAFGRFTLEDKPRILSAEISVLGSDVQAGIRGAGRSFCGSGFVFTIGLFPFCHTIHPSLGDQVIGFTFTAFADVGFPLGAGRAFGIFASSAIHLRKVLPL